MTPAKYTEHIAIFIEVVRTGSFSAAARRHGVKPSTITRKIDNLEEFFGSKLLVRSTRNLAPTDTGKALFDKGSNALDTLTDIHNEIISMNDSMQGVLRISCLPTFGKLHILPWLNEFHNSYPNICINLDFTERFTIPSIERLDAAIRIGKLKDSSLFAKKISTQRWVICASTDYLKKYGHPSSLNELNSFHIIDKLHDSSAICWKRLVDTGYINQPIRIFCCDDFGAMHQAVLNGLGIAFLPDWVIAQDLNTGKLIKLFDDPEYREEEINLIRALPKMSTKLRVFNLALNNHLKKVFTAQNEL